MTKIDIFSGFLGAGKTTLIKKLIKEAYAGEKLVLIENEFGEIGVDGGFLAEAGIKINELNSGCICCSLVGDFAKALNRVYDEYHPDRILIEPSGVGKLSDVIRAVEKAGLHDCVINSATAVVDANKCKMYMKNFGEFFNDQIETAACIVFSHADVTANEKLNAALALVREHNPEATIVTTPWNEIDGKAILAAMEKKDTLASALAELEKEHHEHGEEEEDERCHHHHDDDDEDEHEHHHHHDREHCPPPPHDHGHDHGHEEHHHERDHGHERKPLPPDWVEFWVSHCPPPPPPEVWEDIKAHMPPADPDRPPYPAEWIDYCTRHCPPPPPHHHHDHYHEHEHEHEHCHEHEHEHEHDHDHCCHDEHGHHHHHHADEVFTSWGVETGKKFTAEELEAALKQLEDGDKYGTILRAKGIVAAENGKWLHFDYIPGESNVREGAAAYTGRLCVIGSKINEEALKTLFKV